MGRELDTRPVQLHPEDRPDERTVHVCYRSVDNDPPTEADFVSYWDLGRRPRPHTAKREEEFKGVSVFDTEEHARANALKHGLGPLLARLEIRVGAPVRVTPVRNPFTGHHNLYGAPSDVLACVVAPLIVIETR